MSDSSIPAYADTRKIFLAQENISGNLSLERLPRFSKSLSDSEGSVQIDLRFTLSDAKERLISGSLEARVNIFCQRCLKPLAIELMDDINLALVRDEQAAKQLNPELDPWICEDHRLDLAELVEEQLILCMPLVSFHESGDCLQRRNFVAGEIEDDSHTAESKESPFAILRTLKESDSSD